jgi:hypothetical protein
MQLVCRKRAITGSGTLLFKNLIRASEKRRRDFETERFRCLEIDSKQEFGGPLDGKLGRFGIAASVRSADQMSEPETRYDCNAIFTPTALNRHRAAASPITNGQEF